MDFRTLGPGRLRGALLALLASACGPERTESPPAIVFAAASLTAAFEALAEEFERAHPGHAVELHFAGTPQLVLQIREGAPADVLASADEVNMQRVVELDKTLSAPVTFARNRLAIVVREGNPRAVSSLADLARPELVVLLCGPDVPAGRYARRALASAGVAVASASDEPSVKSVVNKIALGEADAGIVYVTDAAAAADRVDAVPVLPAHDVVAAYPIARLGAGRGGEAADAFVAFVLSEQGQAVLARFGFERP